MPLRYKPSFRITRTPYFEIISHIFVVMYHATSSGEKFIFPFRRQLHLCRRWRGIALGTHWLWTYILDNKYSHMRATFPDLVALKIERSGPLGLEVRAMWDDDDAKSPAPSLVEFFMETLRSVSDQVQEITMDIPHRSAFRAASILLSAYLPRLEVLKIACEEDYNPTTRIALPQLHSPLLRTIELETIGLQPNQQVMARLSRLDLQTSLVDGPSSFRTLLSLCPQVIDLTLGEFQWHSPPHSTPQTPIHVPALRTLSLIPKSGRIENEAYQSDDMAIIDSILQVLNADALETLRLEFHEQHSVPSSTPWSFPSLTTLDLRKSSGTEDTYCQIFQKCSHVTHLRLERCHDLGDVLSAASEPCTGPLLQSLETVHLEYQLDEITEAIPKLDVQPRILQIPAHTWMLDNWLLLTPQRFVQVEEALNAIRSFATVETCQDVEDVEEDAGRMMWLRSWEEYVQWAYRWPGSQDYEHVQRLKDAKLAMPP